MTRKGSRKPDDAWCLTRAETGALLYAAKDVCHDWRAYYMLSIMYLLGLRVSEAINLRYEHLDPRKDRFGLPVVVWVPTKKKTETARQRLRTCPATGLPVMPVPILGHPGLVANIFQRSTRPTAAEQNSPWLFPSDRSPKRFMSRRTALTKFDVAKSRAYLNDAYTSHVLRHTAGTRLHEKCNSQRLVTEFLRHDPTGGRTGDNKTTARYIHITPETWVQYRHCLDLPLPLRPIH